MKSKLTPLIVSLLLLSGCAHHTVSETEGDGKGMAPPAAILQEERDDALRQDIEAKQKRLREIEAQEQQAKAKPTPNQ